MLVLTLFLEFRFLFINKVNEFYVCKSTSDISGEFLLWYSMNRSVLPGLIMILMICFAMA